MSRPSFCYYSTLLLCTCYMSLMPSCICIQPPRWQAERQLRRYHYNSGAPYMTDFAENQTTICKMLCQRALTPLSALGHAPSRNERCHSSGEGCRRTKQYEVLQIARYYSICDATPLCPSSTCQSVSIPGNLTSMEPLIPLFVNIFQHFGIFGAEFLARVAFV